MELLLVTDKKYFQEDFQLNTDLSEYPICGFRNSKNQDCLKKPEYIYVATIKNNQNIMIRYESFLCKYHYLKLPKKTLKEKK